MKLEHGKAEQRILHGKIAPGTDSTPTDMYDFSISTADFGAVANREGWILSELKYGHPPAESRSPQRCERKLFSAADIANVPANRLLYVGTWLDRKGIHYLVDAFGGPGRSLVGNPTHRCWMHSRRRASESILSRRYPQSHLGPSVSRSRRHARALRWHDIFVFPSLVEGMPLTLLEAMDGAMPALHHTSDVRFDRQ